MDAVSVETYPGIRAGQTISPAILASHALAFGALLLLRLEYHRPTLIAGFVLHLLWAFAIYFFVAAVETGLCEAAMTLDRDVRITRVSVTAPHPAG